jgi:hypothetical protein
VVERVILDMSQTVTLLLHRIRIQIRFLRFDIGVELQQFFGSLEIDFTLGI